MANGGGAFNGFPGNGTFLPQPNVALDPEMPLPQPNVHAVRDAEARRAAGSRRTRGGAATGGDQEETQDQFGLHPSAHQLILALLGNMRGAQFPGQNVHPHVRALSDADPSFSRGFSPLLQSWENAMSEHAWYPTDASDAARWNAAVEMIRHLYEHAQQ